jgi:Tfp pilus assembly pilus retraction ATPase PilT
MMADDESRDMIPRSEDSTEDKLLFLQENMVNFVNQYNLPIIETSLVISKYLRILTQSLVGQAENNNEIIPPEILNPIPIEKNVLRSSISEFSLDSLLNQVDNERMDIFDTIIRTIINSSELNFTDAILLLRDWESIIRNQLAKATSPGHLFSPLELPNDF